MRKTLYLHVGTPKTGTSTIQWFLHSNREVLAKHGILYPVLSDKTPGHHYIANNYRITPLAWVEPIPRRKVLDKIAQGMDSIPGLHSLCLSSEAFWGCRKRLRKLRDDFADYDIKVIVLLRRQDDFMNAIYRQDVKASKKVSNVEEFIQTSLRRLRYLERLALLENIFGRENLIVIPFEPSTWKNGLEGILLSLLRIDSINEFKILRQKNISLCNTAILFIKDIIDFQKLNQEGYSATIRKLETYSQKIYKTLGKDHIMSPEGRGTFINSYKDENNQLASRYLQSDRNTLFTLPYEPHTNLRSLEDPLTEQEVNEIENFLTNGSPVN